MRPPTRPSARSYDELDSWLRDLDRELQRTGP